VSAAVQPPALRRATADDVPQLAQMLTRAFLDDPVVAWAFKAERERPRALERFQATRLRQLLEGDEVWTNDDLSCAALWAPPGRWRPGPREEAEVARCFLHPRLIARLPLAALGWQLLERRHPPKPEHWYLAVLGTDPSAQGRGLGSAVLSAMLDQCDRDGVAAYLESSKRRNVDFYARHGFRVLREYRLLRGPIVWPMWRDPRP
jgi:ribosomal protein S18 acetylase RimI-like enzyme